MNKRIILAIVSLLALVTQVSAEDKLTIKGFSITAGETKTLSIELESDVVYAGFQFDMYLPEGISLTEYSADKTRIPQSTALTMSKQADGSYRFLATPMDLEEISGKSGSIIAIKLTADEELEEDSLKGYFRNVKLSDADGAGTTYAEMEFPIIVTGDIEPIKEGETVDFGENSSITEETDLSDTIVDNMYYSIDEEDGCYDADEGCIVITKETSDNQMANVEGKEITDDEVKENFTGIIFKVSAGAGSVMVTAETFGNMTLKVKIGNGDPIELELTGKTLKTIPFSVLEETLVYIFAGTKGQNAARGVNKADVEQGLKIYSISWEQQAGVKGDANNDGTVNAADIVEVVNYIMGNKSDKFNDALADANGDGTVNAADIVTIVNLIMGN